MRKLILITVYVLLCVQIKSQTSVSYSVGYGNYDCEEAREWLESVREQTSYKLGGLNLSIIDNFPETITHTLELAYKKRAIEIGFKSSFYTAGGRLSYADYSGYIDYKVTIRGFREGFLLRAYSVPIPAGNTSSFVLFAELSPALIFSQTEFKSDIGLYAPENSGLLYRYYKKSKSDNALIDLMFLFGTKYFLNKHIGFHVSAGYEWNLEEPKLNIITMEKTKSLIDWTGFRFFGGVSYYFKRK